MPTLRKDLPKVIDYSVHLNNCWIEHLAPKDEYAPTVISSFAGCGGSSLGYSMAGFRELLAIEINDDAVNSFRANFADVPIYHGDIADLSVEQCLQLSELQSGELDIFDGSPPCQGFSTSGKRRFGDARNTLFREYVRLLRGLQPKVFIMENVKGMVLGKMKLIFAEIMRELKDSGYKVSAKLLDARWFGVPQSRQRLIFVGVRNDLGIDPSHPAACFDEIPCVKAVKGCNDGNDVPAVYPKFLKLWEYILPGKSAKDWLGTHWNTIKLDPNKPAPTLPKTQKGTGPFSIMHWDSPRAISICEAKRFSSFPDEFVLLGDYETRFGLIGNSVPPLMMRAIALHIKNNILKV